ncbi:MAG: glycogen debranching protein GlgX [Acidobacteria bacterium]|nr:glycogen debranching protein GlgX [Acidobacteriota bacterium]
MRVWPGSPAPLGATFDGNGTNFALFSDHATKVELCLFDRPGARVEQRRVPFAERTNGVWHAYLPDVRPGQLYGYRVHGPWDPALGHRFNPAKLVLDPYARAFGRELDWDTALFGFERGTDGDGPPDMSDSAPFATLAVVSGHEPFDWLGDRRPVRPWSDTVIYEAHVKGATARHESIPPALRGTFLGLACPPFIEHLLGLGVTAVELLPVHAHADEWEIAETARTNYWGYNTLSFFVPDARFATSSATRTREFKMMVRALHEAGLEVILDVVYNHTAEGGHLGPTLSWRGIDNRSYYRLDPGRPSRYEDFTGCGNTLDLRHPRGLQLVMDSLRFWVTEMHVDGFRFDLTTVLARDSPEFTPRAPLLQAIAQDPMLAGVKLIAEPWDVGPGGFRLGQFPAGWSEWNAYFRDDVRRFWRGDAGMLSKLAYRLSGSSDLFGTARRGPTASINYVIAHDGFTLADLVSYREKHNDANGEGNRDGETNNFSWNCGVEGPTDDATVLEQRDRHRRNLMTTLIVSIGVPMISGGDEVGRSQQGNNNAYCHDSPLSWTPWRLQDRDRDFLAFVRRLVTFRMSHPVFRRSTFLNGAGHAAADVRWLRPEGGEMTPADWAAGDRRALGMLLDGRTIPQRTARGEPIVGATLLVLFNASDADLAFELPAADAAGSWILVLDTAEPTRPAQPIGDQRTLAVPAGSLVVLQKLTA